MKDTFLQRKKSMLSKIDKSSKGYWDRKIIPLCKKINSMENYYTTSSCSGRIVLMIDNNKKEKNLFIKIYHNLITFKQLKGDLDDIIKSYQPTRKLPAHSHSQINKEQLTKNFSIKNIQEERLGRARRGAINSQIKLRQIIKFKQEPCIMHVACKTLEDAQHFYDKARLAGWKKHGIISSKTRFIVEIHGTDKLEFPIIKNNKILVNEDFLKLIVKKSNENLKKSWEKIEKLKKTLD